MHLLTLEFEHLQKSLYTRGPIKFGELDTLIVLCCVHWLSIYGISLDESCVMGNWWLGGWGWEFGIGEGWLAHWLFFSLSLPVNCHSPLHPAPD